MTEVDKRWFVTASQLARGLRREFGCDARSLRRRISDIQAEHGTLDQWRTRGSRTAQTP